MAPAIKHWLALSGLAAATYCNLGNAVGTAAGTAINNTATVTYVVGGSTLAATSNVSSVTVVQIVDVVSTIQTPSVSVAPGDANRILVFRVTNTGNGPDIFTLTPSSTISGDNFDPVLAAPATYFDTDNSGTLTAADTAYVPGADLPLTADGSVTLLVVNNIPAGLNNGDIGRSQLTATRKNGIGVPGTTFAGQGVGGGAAVVGTTGAQAVQSGQYVAAGIQFAIVKSQTIVDQYGGNRAIPGATINYLVTITPSGSGTATATAFSDLIPVNTSFKPGTIKLNATSLTDTTGDDAGQYLATPTPKVTVTLADLTAASGQQRVEFAVTIN
jgi:uncharacterized repeat protein (TIGR01451 family)